MRMSNETYVTLVGQLSKEPEMRFTPQGTGVVNFTVVTNARKFNKQTNEWDKKTGKFWECEAWNQGKALMAENVAQTLKKGDTVIVYGELETREFDGNDGQKRRADRVKVEAVGKDLRWHQQPETVNGQGNNQQGNFGGVPQQSQQFGGQQQGGFNPPAADPWATQPQQNNGWPQ